MSGSKRDRLVDATEALIRSEGYSAASVDRILQGAGAARMTLYNHFGGKDDLLAEVVDRMARDGFAALRDAVEAGGGAPRERLERLITLVLDLAASRAHRGCVFLRSAAEVGDPAAPVRVAAAGYYEQIERFASALAAEAGAADAAEVAGRVVVVLAGAFSLGALRGTERAVEQARSTAMAVVDAGLPRRA